MSPSRRHIRMVSTLLLLVQLCLPVLQFTLVTLLMLPLPALAAMPAITCHCFTDRSYDPNRPAVADPYFLATTQNSFFAAAFGVDKKKIVIQKQKGISSDDLWIAYWLGARSGRDPEVLLQERKTTGTWRQVIHSLAVPAKTLGGRFAEVVQAKVADSFLAQAVVDELLLRCHFHGEPELSALRKAGARNQELVITGLLKAKSRQPAIQIYSEVKSGRTSWGALLQKAKIDPSQIQSEIVSLVTTSISLKPQ